MADEKIVAVAPLAQKGKITLSDFTPARLLGLGPETVEYNLGILIGRGVSAVKRNAPDGSQTFTGLGGAFEAYFTPNADGSVFKAPIASGVLFTPDSFMNMLLGVISDRVNDAGEVVEAGAEAVNFAFAVFAVRAKNAANYEWKLQPLGDRKPEGERDMLKNMRALLPPTFAPYRPALAAPTPPAETPVLDPVTEQLGGKKK